MQLQIIAPSLSSIIRGLGLVVCFFVFTSVFHSNFTIDTSPWIHDLFWNNSLGMQNQSFRICYSFSQVLQGSLQQSNIPRHAISDDVWNRRVRNKKVVLLVSLFTHTPVAWHMNIKSHRTVMTMTSNCFKLKMWILVSFSVPTYPMLNSTRVMICEMQWRSQELIVVGAPLKHNSIKKKNRSKKCQ